jgi:hypothetical protein
MLIRFIGDVHGKYDRYKKIIKTPCSLNSRLPSIQVGDMGVGFRRLDGSFHKNPPFDAMIDDRFIRGNHDNPEVCKQHQKYIADGTIENNMMFIGGGLSIDRQWRVEGFSWWPDEEVSMAELNTMVDVYTTLRPEIMVTHDCPESVAGALITGSTSLFKLNMPSRTRQAFQSMFEIHQPRLWIFGHWHMSLDKIINGTQFICLAELEYRDINV